MTRGGTVLAMVLLLTSFAAPAGAQDGTGTVDVFFKQRGDEYFAGEDLLSSDGVGQSRSLIVRERLTLIVKVQNDGDERAEFEIQGTGPDEGFDVHYRFKGRDVTDDLIEGRVVVMIGPGATRSLRVLVDASFAPFAGVFPFVIEAGPTHGGPGDAARAEITKI